MTRPPNLARVLADDALLDDIVAGRIAWTTDAVTQVLAAWKAAVNADPIPELLTLRDALAALNGPLLRAHHWAATPTDAAGPDAADRPDGADHEETPMHPRDADTAPMPRIHVVMKPTRPAPPRVHPDYRAWIDSPLEPEPPRVNVLAAAVVVALGTVVAVVLAVLIVAGWAT